MAAEEVLKLFDFYWFERELFAAKQTVSNPIRDELRNHDEINAAKVYHDHTGKLKGRSFSDRSLRYDSSSTTSNHSSPKSVITTPKLQKILSGQEICEFDINEEVVAKKSKKKMTSGTKKRGKGMSKSLSELEFEEVKGFTELGFVFTEEDKSTNLVSIIPGLQRLGRDSNEEQIKSKIISRPYLSEAWEVLDNKKANRQLMKMKLSSLPNENEIKHHLKTWAQTVASTVR